jgi:hypothetical protein
MAVRTDVSSTGDRQVTVIAEDLATCPVAYAQRLIPCRGPVRKYAAAVRRSCVDPDVAERRPQFAVRVTSTVVPGCLISTVCDRRPALPSPSYRWSGLGASSRCHLASLMPL